MTRTLLLTMWSGVAYTPAGWHRARARETPLWKFQLVDREEQADRPYECTSCSMAFKTLGNLKVVKDSVGLANLTTCVQNHEKVHTTARPFTCQFCGKSLVSSGELVSQYRSDT